MQGRVELGWGQGRVVMDRIWQVQSRVGQVYAGQGRIRAGQGRTEYGRAGLNMVGVGQG